MHILLLLVFLVTNAIAHNPLDDGFTIGPYGLWNAYFANITYYANDYCLTGVIARTQFDVQLQDPDTDRLQERCIANSMLRAELNVPTIRSVRIQPPSLDAPFSRLFSDHHFHHFLIPYLNDRCTGAVSSNWTWYGARGCLQLNPNDQIRSFQVKSLARTKRVKWEASQITAGSDGSVYANDAVTGNAWSLGNLQGLQYCNIPPCKQQDYDLLGFRPQEFSPPPQAGDPEEFVGELKMAGCYCKCDCARNSALRPEQVCKRTTHHKMVFHEPPPKKPPKLKISPGGVFSDPRFSQDPPL